jgi:hypothetical protein
MKNVHYLLVAVKIEVKIIEIDIFVAENNQFWVFDSDV